jgi:uncharacterized membrane protein
VGWNWHQRQQRALVPPQLVTGRVDAIGAFYTTPDAALARAFLEKYDVRYIVVGQLEQNLYPPQDSVDGLDKFARFEGEYWRSVYHDQSTTLYEVLP